MNIIQNVVLNSYLNTPFEGIIWQLQDIIAVRTGFLSGQASHFFCDFFKAFLAKPEGVDGK